MSPTTRGKTTPASTQGSYAPHSGRQSRVEPDTENVGVDDLELAESWEAFHDKHGQPRPALLRWESLGRDGDGDGDQQADGPSGMYAEIGKDHPTGWSWSVMTNEEGEGTVDVAAGRCDTEAAAKAAAAASMSNLASPLDDDSAALAELRRRGITGYAAILAASHISPTRMVELEDAGVPLYGHGPALHAKGAPTAEIADAVTHGINLYDYDRARSGGELDQPAFATTPSHADVIAAHDRGVPLADFGRIAGRHNLPVDDAIDALASDRIATSSYIDLRLTSGCTHAEAMEVAWAAERDGYKFEAESTYKTLRANGGCSHAEIVEALTHLVRDDKAGLYTLVEYRNLRWDHTHANAIKRLAARR